MRVLLTGATGFAGGYLAAALLDSGDASVVGLSRRGQWPDHWQQLAQRVTLRPCDLSDRAATETLLRDVQPERIFHLAGYASTAESYREPDAAWAANLTATRNLLEAVVRWGGRPRILHVSSGLVYGDPPEPDQPVDETCLVRPVSPYASSKAAADLTAYQFTRAPGLDIVRVRPFNHIGPRQAPQFAVSQFARQLAAIERGDQPPVVETGDLSPRRDLTDVRDMVQAYLLLMDKGTSGEVYNAGSGTAHSMQTVLERLRTLTAVPVEVRQQAQGIRRAESAVLRADNQKLRQSTGWTPRFSLEQTLADTLDYWRTSVVRRP